MPNLELTPEELSLVKALVQQEEAETRVEIHHSRANFQFRDALKAREREIHALLGKLEKLLPGD